MPAKQSPLIWQVLPMRHLVAQVPPQSMAVSVPFLIPSLQVPEGATQRPPVQVALLQSAPTPQVLPLAHLVMHEPPQSTSLSLPFLMPSVQVGSGAAQTPAEQLVLEQSALALQVLPLAHLLAQEPPQSTSVSVPFLTRSLQPGAWQTLPVHLPLWQSPSPPQAWPPPELRRLSCAPCCASARQRAWSYGQVRCVGWCSSIHHASKRDINQSLHQGMRCGR